MAEEVDININVNANTKGVDELNKKLTQTKLSGEQAGKSLMDVGGGINDAFTALNVTVFAGNKSMLELVATAEKGEAVTRAIKGSIELWTGAQELLNAAMLANPIGMIVAGVVALGAGIAFAISKMNAFENSLVGAAAKVKEIQNSLTQDIYERTNTLLKEQLKLQFDQGKIKEDEYKREALHLDRVMAGYKLAKETQEIEGKFEALKNKLLDDRNKLIIANSAPLANHKELEKQIQMIDNQILENNKKKKETLESIKKLATDEGIVKAQLLEAEIETTKQKEKQEKIDKSKEASDKALEERNKKAYEEYKKLGKYQDDYFNDRWNKIEEDKKTYKEWQDKQVKDAIDADEEIKKIDNKTRQTQMDNLNFYTDERDKLRKIDINDQIEYYENLKKQGLKYKDDVTLIEDEISKLKLQKAQETAQNIAQITQGLSDIVNNIQQIELINAGNNFEKQKAIRKKYALLQMGMTVAETIANTASAIVNALTVKPAIFGGILAGIYGGIGLTQIGIANAQRNQIMKLKRGQIGIEGPGSEISDSIPAMLSRGESVINARATRNFKPVLEAINNNQTPQLIDYEYLASLINDKKVYIVSSDMTNQQTMDTKIKNKTIIK